MDTNFVQLLVQYVELRRRLEPLIAPASQKLVKNLVDTGVSTKRIAQVVGRPPGYVRGVYNGQRSLNAQALSDLFRFVARYAPNDK